MGQNNIPDLYRIFKAQVMQSTQDPYERKKAGPEHVNFRTGGRWSHSSKIVFQRAFVSIFKEDMWGPAMCKAAVKAYDAGKPPPERGSQVYKAFNFSAMMRLGIAVVGLENESII